MTYNSSNKTGMKNGIENDEVPHIAKVGLQNNNE